MSNNKIIIETERLQLRPFRLNDLDPMAAINEDRQVCEFLPTIGTREATLQFIERVIAHHKKNGFSLYATELKSSREMIGFVGLLIPSFEAHFTPAVEIGWRLGSQYWGNGYATEAAIAVLDYGFTEIDLDEIVSFTVPANIRSKRVMKKIGLHHNPEDDFDHPRLEKAHPLCRHILYKLTREEYLNNMTGE